MQRWLCRVGSAGVCLLLVTRLQAGPLRVSLVGAYRSATASVFERQEFFAGVRVTVPWQELLASPAVQALRREEALESHRDWGEEALENHRDQREEALESHRDPLRPEREDASWLPLTEDAPLLSETGLAGATSGVPKTAATGAVRPKETKVATSIDSALLRNTVAVALRASSAPETAAGLDALSARARTSAALPELGLSAERAFDESLRLAPTLSDPYRYTQAGGDTLKLEARLTWQLDELVFSRSELVVARLQQVARARQATLVELVLKQFFAWQSAHVKQDQPQLEPEQRLALWLQEFEARARLDVVTDGWFGRQVGPMRELPTLDVEPSPEPAPASVAPPGPAPASKP